MRGSRLFFISVAISTLVLVAHPNSIAMDRLVIGVSPSLTATLDVVAEQKGYFAGQGLAVELRNKGAGSKAVASMLAGDIDLSESTMFALVSNSFERKDFKILAELAVAGNDNMILARKSHGILAPTDLRGKRIGVLFGGFMHYVMNLMLAQADLKSQDVQTVYDDPDSLVRRIAAGELDAVCLFGAWVERAQKVLGEDCATFYDESLVRVTIALAGRTSDFDRDPGLFVRLLRAYIQAEKFVRENPDAALEIVCEKFQLDKTIAKTFWKPNLFYVTLDQSMIIDMENMARWQVEMLRGGKGPMPNFLDFINYNILETVEPAREKIVH